LLEVRTFPGNILDIKYPRFLYESGSDDYLYLNILDIVNNNNETVIDSKVWSNVSGYGFYPVSYSDENLAKLTENGLIFKPPGKPVLEVIDSNIYSYESDEKMLADSFLVNGDYFYLKFGSYNELRKISTQTKLSEVNFDFSENVILAKNGKLFDISNNFLHIYDSGESEFIATLGNHDQSFDLVSDGKQLLYWQKVAYNEHQVVYFDGSDFNVMYSYNPDEISFDATNLYAIDSGWVAFVKNGKNNIKQIWTISPEGQFEQRTFFNSDSYIDSISNDGELMIFNSNQRKLIDLENKFTEVGSTLGASFKENGYWYVYYGNKLFKL
jgi:dipeptidyl aminopeptidase/acylaminoacyl peptidase